MLGRRKVMIVSLLLTYAIIVPVFAYLYFYATEPKYVATGIILRTYDTPTMQLGFYWDSVCQQPITSFDFGNITYPNQETVLSKEFYIRNEGSVWIELRENSTLGTVTTSITQYWGYHDGWYWRLNLNGTRIDAGGVLIVRYHIRIPAYTTVGTFNWTLTVWGETYY
jgi:hypothetical protein